LTIGEAIRAAREERNESIEDVERATQVSKKYIMALEANDLRKLPEPVYAKKFVKTLAAHFGIDQAAAAENLMKEMAVSGGVPVSSRPVNFIEGRSLVVTPTLFKTALAATIFLGIVGYFAYSVYNILKPPTLTVYSPHDDEAFPTSRVVLEGVTEPEVDLKINGESVAIEHDGSFKDILNLPPGVSNLRLAAKKKHSHENQIFMKVVVEGAAAIASGTTTEELGPPLQQEPSVTEEATSTAPVVSKPKKKPVPKPEQEPSEIESASSTEVTNPSA
jgi:transcriptional regulator with XRE-family HTH domain